VTTVILATVVLMLVLGELGISLGPLLASAGVAGVAIGFGAQSIVRDFLSGLFMLIEDQYGVGDIIDVGEATGTVEQVGLRTTRLRDVKGTVWYVPNGTVARVGNMSQQWARALLDVAVAHEADLTEAETAIKRAADSVWQDEAWAGQILEEPEVWGVEDMGPQGMTIRLVVKTEPAKQFNVLRELRRRIKAELVAADVPTPSFQPAMWSQRDPKK
jgi:small conductance mechanosensitive channel